MALTWDQYKAQAAKFRTSELQLVGVAQQTENTAAASPNPDGHAIAAGQWTSAGQAAMAIEGLVQQYWAQGVQVTDPAELLAGNTWKKATQAGADQLGAKEPMASSKLMSAPSGGKTPAQRAWYYNIYSNMQKTEATKKGAAPAPKPPPPVMGPKPAGSAISTAVSTPGSWAPVVNAALVPRDPVTGVEIDPVTGTPAAIGEGIGALIPGETAAGKIGWLAVIGAVGYVVVKTVGRRL